VRTLAALGARHAAISFPTDAFGSVTVPGAARSGAAGHGSRVSTDVARSVSRHQLDGRFYKVRPFRFETALYDASRVCRRT